MTLKSILHETIHRHPTKGVAEIAEEIEISESYLYRAALPDKDDVSNPDLATGCRFPLKKLARLIQVTGDYRVLDHIEAQVGRVAFNVPDKAPGQELVHRQLSKSITEFGELIQAVGDSIQDGTITRPERERCKKEGYDLIQAVALLLHMLK